MNTQPETPDYCNQCGVIGGRADQHIWIEGDCLLPHRLDRPNHPPAAKHGLICGNCVDRHKTTLTEILELWATLHLVVAQGSIHEELAQHQKPRKQPGSPAPMRLTAWIMLYDRERLRPGIRTTEGTIETLPLTQALPDIPAVLAGWATQIQPTIKATDTAAIAALTVNAEAIGHQPWVDEYDTELRWILTKLRNAHAITNQKPLARCIQTTNGHRCTGHVWPRSSTAPKCDRCHHTYGTLELVRLRAIDAG
jgi:hypothetical protein